MLVPNYFGSSISSDAIRGNQTIAIFLRSGIIWLNSDSTFKFTHSADWALPGKLTTYSCCYLLADFNNNLFHCQVIENVIYSLLCVNCFAISSCKDKFFWKRYFGKVIQSRKFIQISNVKKKQKEKTEIQKLPRKDLFSVIKIFFIKI